MSISLLSTFALSTDTAYDLVFLVHDFQLWQEKAELGQNLRHEFQSLIELQYNMLLVCLVKVEVRIIS